MPSPFPGMDPYLEGPEIWPDLHGDLIYIIRKHLHLVLPDRYVARVDRHVWVHEPDGEDRVLLGRPDVYAADSGDSGGGTGVAVEPLADPAVVVLPYKLQQRHRFIRVLDARQRHVVTVIELLSPSNKAGGPDRDAYLAKRNDYLVSGLNLVEIDLLRGGQRAPLGAPPPADYYVLIARAARLPQAGIWPIALRQPLPNIPIPLDPDVPEVEVGLQQCLNEAYDEGRFAVDIDYTQPPNPPLHDPDATWARDLLAARNPAGG